MSAVAEPGQAGLELDAIGASSFTLPGKGTKPSSCGVWYPAEFCNHCGDLRFSASRCLNRSCPECWTSWSRDRAAAITLRLAAARHVGLWNQTETHRCDVAEHTVDGCPDCGRVRCSDLGRPGHSVDECPSCFDRRCEDHQPGHRVDECPDCGERPVEPVSAAHAKRAVHGMVSAPEGAVESVEDVAEAFSTVYELAAEHGVRGGVVLFHGYRLTEAADLEWKEQRRSGETELKKWAWVREQPGDWRDLAEWSPHWHIIGLSDDFEAASEESTGGWTVKNIRSLDRFEIDRPDGYRDMYFLARYLLSHTAVEIGESTDSVRWYGELHPVNFNPDPTDLDRELTSPLERSEYREIERHVAALTGREPGEEGDGREPCESCGAEDFSPIYLAREALQRPSWCDSIGRERQRRLLTAWEWVVGDRKPPPGLKRPTSREDALEALEAML